MVDINDIISGKVSLSAEDENICKEHREPYKYYCTDEKKAICQDCVILKECPTEHDRITLDKAVENQTRQLKGLLKTTTGLLKKYEGAVRSTEIVAKELEIHSTLAKDALAEVKQDYIKCVEDIGKHFEAKVDKIKMNRINELGKRKNSFELTMKDIQKVNDDAAKLIKSESKMAVLSFRTTQFKKTAAAISANSSRQDTWLCQVWTSTTDNANHWKSSEEWVTSTEVETDWTI